MQNDAGGGFRQPRHYTHVRRRWKERRSCMGVQARGSTDTHTRLPHRLTDGETGRREIRGEMRLAVDGQMRHYTNSNTKTDLCSSSS